MRGMIADRDVRMEKIKRKTEELAERNIQLCRQLEEVSTQVAQQTATISSERTALMTQYKTVVDKLDQLQRDFKQQGASLQTYSKDSFVTKIGNDASYVMRMQAQLCKAMHSLGITDHQMELAQKHSDLITKYQKEKLVQCREEHTATELGLMNQLIVKDNERREIEDALLAKLEAIAKERDALERQMEESGHDLEDDEDGNAEEDEEVDEEEKAEKEELMQLLSERRAEIDRLEQLQEEQEDLIAELEEQLAEGAGSGTITQRKSQALVEDEVRLPVIEDDVPDDDDDDADRDSEENEEEFEDANEPEDKLEEDLNDDNENDVDEANVVSHSEHKDESANGVLLHDSPENESAPLESVVASDIGES